MGSIGSAAYSINDAGRAVGITNVGYQEFAIKWSHGKVIDLGGLPNSTLRVAYGINDAGQAVGYSNGVAVEWSHGKVIGLGLSSNLSPTFANSINNVGQVAGYGYVGNVLYATEWSDGSVINLGPGIAYGINDAGQAVGYSYTPLTPPVTVPEPSTWAMMLLGFAGLGFAGYRRAS